MTGAAVRLFQAVFLISIQRGSGRLGGLRFLGLPLVFLKRLPRCLRFRKSLIKRFVLG